MVSKAHALARDALVRALTAYSGIATADGAADGTTIVDSNLIGRNDFITEKTILIMSGDAKDEDTGAASFDNGTGTITLLGTGFSAQIKAGTVYRILNISTVEIDVANIDAKIGTNTDPAGTTTLFAWMAKLFTSVGGVSGTVNDVAPAITDFDTDLAEATEGYYNGGLLLFLDGPNVGQAHTIDIYTGATKNVSFVLGDQWKIVPVNGNPFVILPSNAAYLLAAIVNWTQEILYESADIPVNINAIAASETNVLNLFTASNRYVIRNLRLKAVDPDPNNITVRLYELVNDVLTVVDTFIIDNANFGTYHSLMDMFGLPHLAGGNLKITVQASAGGPYAITGEYAHAAAVTF